MKTFDIIKDPELYSCNDSLNLAIAQLRIEGKGDAEHYSRIEGYDIFKKWILIRVQLLTATLGGLLCKIQDGYLSFLSKWVKEHDTNVERNVLRFYRLKHWSKILKKNIDEQLNIKVLKY